jgi:hypothetical protein
MVYEVSRLAWLPWLSRMIECLMASLGMRHHRGCAIFTG